VDIMPPLPITGIVAQPLPMPLVAPFTIATGVQERADNVLVRVRLGEGADACEGLGEAAPFPAVSGETQGGALLAVHAAADLLLGRDARHLRTLCALLTQALPAEPAARCGIEMALCDALLRHHHLPLWVHFGGGGTVLHTDMTITAGDRDHAAAAARAIADRGILTLKVKIGALSPELDAERLWAIHQAVPQGQLLADANGGYTVPQALHFLSLLQHHRVPLALLEQPVPREDQAGLLAVASRSVAAYGVPICADESARTAADVLQLVRSGGAQAINIKLMKSGLFESLAMYEIARAVGLQLMIGGMVESILGMTFSAHFAAGLSGFSFVDLDTPMFIAAHPFSGGFRQEGSRLTLCHIAEGHGVGLA
jgi:L-alanine-DL-glutamate epimerase-like enolase superfamily enzyme